MAITTDPLVDSDSLKRWALRLAYATIAWNLLEAVAAITAGAAGSVGLVSFGLDSTIEVASALVVVWQFRGGRDEQRERPALRAIAISFFALAAYAGVQAIVDLVMRSEPDSSVPGIVISALSLVVMPVLASAKRRVGRRLTPQTVIADSAQTLLCTYLSAALLVGLVLNAAFGWWWADPLVALVVAVLAATEGRSAWHGETDNCSTLAHVDLAIATAAMMPTKSLGTNTRGDVRYVSGAVRSGNACREADPRSRAAGHPRRSLYLGAPLVSIPVVASQRWVRPFAADLCKVGAAVVIGGAVAPALLLTGLDRTPAPIRVVVAEPRTHRDSAPRQGVLRRAHRTPSRARTLDVGDRRRAPHGPRGWGRVGRVAGRRRMRVLGSRQQSDRHRHRDHPRTDHPRQRRRRRHRDAGHRVEHEAFRPHRWGGRLGGGRRRPGLRDVDHPVGHECPPTRRRSQPRGIRHRTVRRDGARLDAHRRLGATVAADGTGRHGHPQSRARRDVRVHAHEHRHRADTHSHRHRHDDGHHDHSHVPPISERHTHDHEHTELGSGGGSRQGRQVGRPRPWSLPSNCSRTSGSRSSRLPWMVVKRALHATVARRIMQTRGARQGSRIGAPQLR